MSTAAKHTPGSWKAEGFTIKAKCNGIVVADVRGPDRRARGKEWQEDMDYCRGNASLIAAAPELLEALQEALAVITDYLEYEHNGDPWTEDARAMGEMDIDDFERNGRLEAARRVIAKAINADAGSTQA